MIAAELFARARSVSIQRELQRRGVKLRGNGINLAGPCPRCGGNDRFGVNTKKNIWHCRKCDAGGDVIELVRHLDGCDLATAVRVLAGEPPPKAKGHADGPLGPEPPPASTDDYGADAPGRQARAITATYDYRDANDQLQYQVCRREWTERGRRKKSFLQRRPYGPILEDQEKQQWIWGLSEGTYLRGRNGDFYLATEERVAKWAGAERVEVEACPHMLYMLPELREELAQDESERRTIMVCEGERDVETLIAWGCCAVTNSGGAGNWRPHHAEELRGADVVILEDHDEAGRKRGQTVALSLHGVAARVRVLRWPLHWPGCIDGADISDWRDDGGGNAEKFFAIVEGLPIWEPPPGDHEQQPDEPATDRDMAEATPQLPRIWIRVVECAAQEIPERDWIIPNILPAGEVALFNGHGGGGKTIVALQLAVAIVLGEDWLGHLVTGPGAVWFISSEETKNEIARRVRRIIRARGGRDESCLDGFEYYCCLDDDQNPVLAREDTSGKRVVPTPWFNELLARTTEFKPRAIIIENVADVFAGSEIDRWVVGQFIATARRLTHGGAAVLLLQHLSVAGLRGEEKTSGSTQWHNAVRSRFSISGVKEDDTGNLRQVEFHKANYGLKGRKVVLEWRDGVYVPVASAASALEKLGADRKVEDAFLRCLDIKTDRDIAVRPTESRTGVSMFSRMPEGDAFKPKDYSAAMERLLSAGRIKTVADGRDTRKLVRCASNAENGESTPSS